MLQKNDLQAQKAWTLNDCVTYARANNISLKQLGLNTKRANINHDQSKANRLPNLNGSTSYGLNFGFAIDPTTNTFSSQTAQSSQLSLSSSVILFNGFQLKNTIEQRQLEQELSKLEVDNLANNIDLTVFTAYMQILLAEEQLKVLEKQTTLTDSQYEQVQKLINVGLRPAGDLLELEAQKANDEVNIVNSKNAVKTAYLALSQALDYYGDFEIETPNKLNIPSLDALKNVTVATIFEAAKSSQPQIKTAVLRTDIAEQQHKVLNGSKYPTLSLSSNLNTRFSSLARRLASDTPLGYDTLIVLNLPAPINDDFPLLQPIPDLERTPFFQQFSDNFGGFIGFNLAIPIYNRSQIKNSLALAYLNIQNSKLAQDFEKNNLQRTVEQAFLDATVAAETYRASQKAVSAQKQALDFAQKRFAAGVINTFEVLTIQNAAAITELNMQSAKYQYYFRMKILDFYAGKGISID
ncbi:MAG: TolC family protein [Chitinophagales bacterium]